MDDGERYTPMCLFLVYGTVQLNIVKIVCVIVCDFYHNKKLLKKKKFMSFVYGHLLEQQ